MRKARLHSVILFVSLLSLCWLASSAQKPLPGQEPPKKEGAGKKPKATKPASGVLLVLTDPPGARVIIRNSRGAPLREQMSDPQGELRVALPPGDYEIEVRLDKYATVIKKAAVVRAKTIPVRADLIPIAGSLSLRGDFAPDTEILVDGKPPVNIKRAVNQIDIAGLDAGVHTVEVRHATIENWEEKIEVKGGAVTRLTVPLKRRNASLAIKTEPGAFIYLDNNPRARADDNGQAVISDIPSGRHSIRSEKDFFESAERQIDLMAGKQEAVEMPLAPLSLSPVLKDSFKDGIAQWDAPPTWQHLAEPGNVGMIVKGAGIGFAKDLATGRHHLSKNFIVTFSIVLRNGKGAVWALRAKDEKNYYMFHLIAPAGATTGLFRSYICQNGQARLLREAEMVPENLSLPDNQLNLTVEVRGDTIKHSIQSNLNPQSEPPKPFSLLTGVVYLQGGVGFGALEGEEFIVRFFTLEPVQ